MIKNYFLIAIRNLIKNKNYVVINTFGLGISLACCITAYLLLAFNIEFDNFHHDKKVANIFTFHTRFNTQDGKSYHDIMSPMFFAPEVARNVAGIERYTRFCRQGGSMQYGDQVFSEGIAFSDSTFFDMFTFPLVRGNYISFKDKRSIFINEDMAKKYFAEEDPVGKTLVLNFPNETIIEAIVGGVFANIPANSSLVFNSMMRIENYIDIYKMNENDWGSWRTPTVFAELTSPENAQAMTPLFGPYVKRRNEVKKDEIVQSYTLEPFKSAYTGDEIHATSISLRNGFSGIVVFSSMAGLILLIACFNLTNTSIALTAKRLKEVGVRKTIGAARSQIILQFLLETLVIITMALVAGLVMAQFIVPEFTEMWNFPFGIKDLSSLNLFITLVILVFTACLLAGIYPALFGSKFKPVSLLKGTIKIKGTNGLTRTLIAFQFALSVIVLVAGVVFMQNSEFQETLNFGYDKNNVLVVFIQGERDFELMKNALSTNTDILETSASDHLIGGGSFQNPVKVGEKEYTTRVMNIGHDYFKTIGLKIVDGREFSTNIASDAEEAIIVNRAFLKKSNLDNPIDKVITLQEKKRYIVGVVEDHIDNLYRSSEPEPFVFSPAVPGNYHSMAIKVADGRLVETRKFLEATWKNLFPGKPFQERSQDDILLGNARRENANLEKIFLFLTLLGGLLSASGIFSLASLNTAKRTKEIGVRKVLGASVKNIVSLINKEFTIILAIAALIGAAAGYYLTDALLSEIYAYHITVGLIPVALCALLIFVIGVGTTSTTIQRAASANPVNTLRSE